MLCFADTSVFVNLTGCDGTLMLINMYHQAEECDARLGDRVLAMQVLVSHQASRLIYDFAHGLLRFCRHLVRYSRTR